MNAFALAVVNEKQCGENIKKYKYLDTLGTHNNIKTFWFRQREKHNTTTVKKNPLRYLFSFLGRYVVRSHHNHYCRLPLTVAENVAINSHHTNVKSYYCSHPVFHVQPAKPFQKREEKKIVATIIVFNHSG